MKSIGLTFQIAIDGWKIKPSIIKLISGTIRPTINGVTAKNGGIRFDIGLGKFRAPIPKFWKWQMYVPDYITRESNTNPWNSGNYWFVMDIPIFPILYFFLAYGIKNFKPGFYIGMKSYQIEQRPTPANYVVECQLKEFKLDKQDIFLFNDDGTPILTWCKQSDLGKQYITTTASIRSNMIDG